jgi:RNA 2',3'-cyclic 3'-phosphodiesterase
MNHPNNASLNEDSRRLFFGAHTEAPWPNDYPSARMISEETRHLTLAFLGQDSFSKLQQLLPSVPRPSFAIGPVGIAKQLIFLPQEKSRVVAASVDWLDASAKLNVYQKALADWLQSNGYPLDKRSFFPHITIARAPFDKKQWKVHFTPLPFFVKAIHLYQSLGNLQYRSLWESPLLPPFEELEHTADIAFQIRGDNIRELHLHAQLALAFKFPQLTDFFTSNLQDSLEEMIISLNEMVAIADAEFGCPFKAVSFHGMIKSDAHNILHWEMIVDV